MSEYDNYSRDLLIEIMVDLDHQIAKQGRLIERLRKNNDQHDRDLLREFWDTIDGLISGGLMIPCNRTGSYGYTRDMFVNQFLKERTP